MAQSNRGGDVVDALAVTAVLPSNSGAVEFHSTVTRADEPKPPAIPSATSSTVLIRGKPGPRLDLWQRAWKELKRDDEKLVKRYTGILDSYTKLSASATLQEKLWDIIDERRKEITTREWKFSIGKKPRRVRDLFENILKPITALKDFGTAAASLDPIHVGLPWAGVCVLLPLFLNNFSQETLAMEGLAKISAIVENCARIEYIYSRDRLAMFRDDVDDKLVKLYTSILQFQAQAASQFNHNTFVRTLRNGAKLDDWQGLLDKIDAAKNECMTLLMIVGLDTSDQSLSQIQQRLEEIYVRLDQSLQRGLILSYEIQDIDTEFDKLVKYLIKAKVQPPEYAEDLENSLTPQREYPSSSTWILQHPKYLQWLTEENGSLWIHGKPGSGKSVLAAVIVDDLCRARGILTSDGRPATEYIGSVFCRDQTKRSALAVMKILACQLLDQLQRSALRREQKFQILLEWREMWNPGGEPRTTPFTLEKCLLKLIGLVLQSFRGVYLVVDGLDDCKDPKKVVEQVQGFCARASQICNLHVLLVSQKTSQLLDTIPPSFQQIDLNNHHIREKSDRDIRIVTSGILSESKDPALIQLATQVTDLIVERSDGMILWGTLAARNLLRRISFLEPCNMETIRGTIEQLPTDIENLYAHLFQRCFPDKEEPEMYAWTLNILRWVLWSTRPLTLMELEVAMHSDQLEVISSRRDSAEDPGLIRLRKHITTFCCPLISIQQDDTVTVVHLTFKHFVQQWKRLESPIHQLVHQLSEAQSSLMMAQSCLRYLNNPHFQQFQDLLDDITDSTTFNERYCFFDYAAIEWVHHWSNHSTLNSVNPTLNQLFHALSSGDQGLTWLERYRILTNMSLEVLLGLQANVNRLTGPSEDKQWLLKLFKSSKARKHGIYGKTVSPAIRFTTIGLASLYLAAGRTEEARDLYVSLLAVTQPDNTNNFDTTITMSNLALVQAEEGKFKDAETNMKAVVAARKQNFGDHSLPTAAALHNMATVYCKQRRFKEAETLLQKVIKIRTDKLGKYHRDTVISKNNIHQIYSAVGKFKEAKDILVELLERFPQKSAGDSLIVLRLKHNLAAVHSYLGEYTQAEKEEVDVLQQRTNMLGRTHKDTLETLNNLVFNYLRQRKYHDAERLGREGVETARDSLGPESPHTLVQQNNLASALENLRRFEESKRLHEVTYEARRKVLGPRDFNTLMSLNHLASLNRELGDYAKAEKQSAQALQYTTLLDGPENPSTLDALSTMALLSHERGRYSMAAELQARVLERRRKVLGEDHPDTIFSLAVLGVYQKSLGLLNESEKCLRQALAIAPKVWSTTHTHYLNVKRNAAQIYALLGQLDKAESMLVPVVKTFKETLGERNPMTALAMAELAFTQFYQRCYDESMQLAEKVVEIRSYIMRRGHPTLLAMQCLIGRIRHAQGDLTTAEETLHNILKQMKNTWGEDHPIPLRTTRFLALVMKDKGDLYQAENLLVPAIEASIHRPGFWHPDTLSSIDDLSMLYFLRRCHTEALELQHIVLEARRKLLGPAHPDSVQSELNLKQISNDEPLPLSLRERILAFIPKWTGGYVKDPRPLLNSIRLASERDYQYWALSYTALEMKLVLGPNQWETVESRRQVALRTFDAGDFAGSVRPMKQSWLKHRKVFGTTDSRTLARFSELCKCWAALGSLAEKIHQESPHALSWAVKAGDEKLLGFLLERGIEPDQVDGDGRTPLFHAATIDRPISTSLVRQLLEAGASTKWTGGSLTLLHLAAKANRLHIGGLLLEYDADIDALCPEGHTPLYYASSAGHLGFVKRLLRSKQKPSLDLVGPSTIKPLHAAVYYGFGEIVELLLDAGADIEAISIGLTPLQVAVEYKKDKMLRLLLSRGASPNSSGREPFAIHTAAKKGFREILKVILESKVDVNCQDGQGRTAIFWAAVNGHDAILDYLLEEGGDSTIPNVKGLTPFHMAALEGHVRILKRLLELTPSNISITSKAGWTPLHLAAEGKSLEAVECLLTSGADPDVATAQRTVLQKAILARAPKIVECLIAAGVEINAQSYFQFTALHSAVSTGQLEIVSLLLQHGARPEHRNALGITALHIAAQKSDIPIMRRLIQETSTVIDAQAAHGLTSLHLASSNGQRDVVEILLQGGADPNLTDSFGGIALSYAVKAYSDDVISVLLPLTQDPLLLDCFGRNCLDWASLDATTFAKMGKWTKSFSPTKELDQKSHLRESILLLTTNLLATQEKSDYGYPFLGRCLLFMEDIERAEQAYLVDIEQDGDGPIQHGISCDLCQPKSLIKGDLSVCLVCPSRTLCSTCMDKYTRDSIELRGCVGHDYHKITGRRWRLPTGSSSGGLDLTNEKGQSLGEWLLEIRILFNEGKVATASPERN